MSRAFVTTDVDGQRRRFELLPGELATVGRSASCQVRIPHQSVSREHCVAVFTGEMIRINNLASRHGVVFGGERVDQCELRPGDRCRLGSADFVFDSTSEDAAPAAAVAREPEPEPERQSAPEPTESTAPDEAPIEPSVDEPTQPVREIAGYRILEPLGSGGFGTVYRAEQVRLGREVALKVLRLDAAVDTGEDTADRIEAFQREARAAAAIDDPRLVQVFDVGQDDGVHYLSMELVTGGSLAGKVRRHGPMEWRDVLSLIRDVALALKAAHAQGLVHRDVKPANILLTGAGQAKLTDLGLAAGTLAAGTVAFMAPEQLRRGTIDERTDIYALGCTAYAALVGRAPFTGSKKDVARAHVRDEPESLQRLGVRVPWHLEQLIIDSMMAKAPAERPASAVELLERLDRLILPGSGAGPASPTAVRASPRRDPDQPFRGRPPGPAHKRLLARILSELIVFTIIAAIVVTALLVLKYGWDFDIYRFIGR